jgi:hypothetical protein
MRYYFRCKAKTEHHMHKGFPRCSLYVWKKFKQA